MNLRRKKNQTSGGYGMDHEINWRIQLHMVTILHSQTQCYSIEIQMLRGQYLFSKTRSTCCNCSFTMSILKIFWSDSASTTAIVISKCMPTASKSAMNLSGSANPEVYPKRNENGYLRWAIHNKKKGPKKPHST